MQDENEAGPPEGEAVPETGLIARAETVVEDAVARAEAAIERWYARHFHAAVVEGRQPISADDKAALIQSVADAVAPAPKE